MFIAAHCEEPPAPSGATRTSHRTGSRSIRVVGGHEFACFRDHLLRLGPGCRRSRFGNETTDAFVKGCAASVNHANSLVLGFFEAEQMRGTAALRSLREGWCEEAEAAFSVEQPRQLRAVGTVLMVETARAACLTPIRVRREPGPMQLDSGANIESLTAGIVVIDL